MAKPDVVGLINVGTAHVGVFGSVEALLATKLEIFRDSPADAVQVAYHDDPRIVAAARKTGKKTLTFGISPDADICLSAKEWLPEGGMSLRLRLGHSLRDVGDIQTISLAVAHEMFPINAAAAAAMAIAAGAKASSISKGLNGFRGVKGRYYLHQLGSYVVVDDTYNANPESMSAGLATVSRAYRGRQIVMVLGDMLELGTSSEEAHRRVGVDIVARYGPAFLITVGNQARAIAAAAVDAGYPKAHSRSFATVDDLLASHIDIRSLGDVLYAKGSNGIKLSKLVEALVGDRS